MYTPMHVHGQLLKAKSLAAWEHRIKGSLTLNYQPALQGYGVAWTGFCLAIHWRLQLSSMAAWKLELVHAGCVIWCQSPDSEVARLNSHHISHHEPV